MNSLIHYSLLKEENLKQLIQFVISEPDLEDAQNNQKKAYKFENAFLHNLYFLFFSRYPFVCADVLSSDSQAIVSEFFKTNQELSEVSAIHKAEEAEDLDEVNTDDGTVDKPETTEQEATTEETQEEEKSTEETETSQRVDTTEKQATPAVNEYPYLDYLFTFLDAKEMNLTSAGYFAKIVNNLFTKKPSAVKPQKNNSFFGLTMNF